MFVIVDELSFEPPAGYIFKLLLLFFFTDLYADIAHIGHFQWCDIYLVLCVG